MKRKPLLCTFECSKSAKKCVGLSGNQEVYGGTEGHVHRQHQQL